MGKKEKKENDVMEVIAGLGKKEVSKKAWKSAGTNPEAASPFTFVQTALMAVRVA